MKTKIIYIIILLVSLNMVAQIDRSKQPKSGPAPKINLGTPQTFTLKSGLKVLVVENHKLPSVTATLTLDNKPHFLGNKKGVEDLLGGMLGTGTKTMSKNDFDEKVDFLGARISFWDEGARLNTLSKYFPEILNLMADAVLNPVFNPEEFDKQLKQGLEAIKSSKNSVKAIAGQVGSALTYGKKHPFGEFTTEETLNNVTLNDVKNQYETFFKPNNAYLIIIGDVDFKSVKKQVKKIFKNWKTKELPTSELIIANNPSKTEINFINMPNAVQSEIAIENTVNLKMTNKDYFAALLANQILGGGGTARLYKNLREDKGYTYGAYSRVSDSRYASRFRATASVRNMVTDSAVVEFIKEIKGLINAKADQDELDLVKAKYVGSFVRNVEKPATIANYALNMQRLNLPADFYQNYLKNIEAVTLEQVNNAAKKYFKIDNARIIITGKALDVIPNLEKLPYTINYFDTKGNPADKPEMNKPIPAGVTLQTIVDNFVKAIGGKDKVAAVKSVMEKSQASMQGMKLDMTRILRSPNNQTTLVGMGGNIMQKNVFDGEKGYEEARGQKKVLDGDDLEEAKNSTAPFEELGITKNGELIGIENVNGKDNYVVKTGKGSKTYFDVESGLKTQVVKIQKNPNRKDTTRIIKFSDYKEVNGIKFPHMMKMAMGPMILEFKTTEIKINEGVTDADFE